MTQLHKIFYVNQCECNQMKFDIQNPNNIFLFTFQKLALTHILLSYFELTHTLIKQKTEKINQTNSVVK